MAKYSFYIFRSADGNMISMSLYDNFFFSFLGLIFSNLASQNSGNSTAHMKRASTSLLKKIINLIFRKFY